MRPHVEVGRSDNPARRSAEPRWDTLLELLLERGRTQASDVAYVFCNYGPDAVSRGQREVLTYGDLLSQAMAIACELQARDLDGKPVLLLYAPGLDFIRAYCACLLAGAIATPVRPPVSPQERRNLQAICESSGAPALLTSSSLEPAVLALLRDASDGPSIHVISVDKVMQGVARAWRKPRVVGEDLALLQYTSGSTGRPKGVMVSHGNLLHNESVIAQAFGHGPETVVVGWLPMFHDMGLIGNVLQPLYLGVTGVLMSPLAFVQKPVRWLQLITEFGATTSGGPNFGYDMCVRRISESDKSDLDLSRWSLAFSGAEPIRMETVRRFAEAFAVAGFRASAFYPCYGLAESTLFVSGGEKGQGAEAASISRSALAEDRVEDRAPSDTDAIEIVCCGRPRAGQVIRIVDPHSHLALRDGQIGEIWIAGDSSGRGYWGDAEISAEVFGAHTADEGMTRAYLRTGDLGFLRQGKLYVTGRLKDLIIIRGRNHYPQDIEATATRLQEAFRPGCAAAFAIDDGQQEGVVLVQEVDPGRWNAAASPGVAADVRAAVMREHGIHVHDLRFVGPRVIPKTSSGKLQRKLCKELYVSGKLREVKARSAGEER